MPLAARTTVALLGLALLVALSSPSLAAKKKPKCPKGKEAVGCTLKSAGFIGTSKSGGQTYGFLFTIGSSASTIRGAVQGHCSGGDPQVQPRSALLSSLSAGYPILKLPKAFKIGKTYVKSGNLDQVQNTGQIKVRVIAHEKVTIKILSAKRARVTLFTDRSTQNVEPPGDDPPYSCTGVGTETIKRQY